MHLLLNALIASSTVMCTEIMFGYIY